MSHPLTTRVVAEAAEHSEKFNHWWVGLIALVLLFGVMGALVFFGGGREHS